jgi:hypothetical protein
MMIGQHAVESQGLATLNPPEASSTAKNTGKVIRADFGVRAELPLAA